MNAITDRFNKLLRAMATKPPLPVEKRPKDKDRRQEKRPAKKGKGKKAS